LKSRSSMADPDKSQRSVFVGNIPYEATEEKLKEIFSEVGPVISFKLVYDRESGKPKGYGFCEYKDADVALSAMRNLNGYEIGGRALRVDNASSEKNRMQQREAEGGGERSMLGAGPRDGGSLGGQQPGPPLMMPTAADVSPYGEPVDPERAPENISKAVASLPPENMFELMKQMQHCIQNNPQEARTMLNHNPQLAYALLQAQVVMRIVDPELAVTMLHKTPPKPPMFNQMVPPNIQAGPPGGKMDMGGGPRPFGGPPPGMQGGGAPPGGMGGPPLGGPPPNVGPMFGDQGGTFSGPPGGGDMSFGGGPSHGGPPSGRRDPREDRFGGRDPRSRDPRGSAGPSGVGAPRGAAPQSGLPPHLAGADPEKAALIMQVLKLTDEQIALLPVDQRESIMQLKKQINSGQ